MRCKHVVAIRREQLCTFLAFTDLRDGAISSNPCRTLAIFQMVCSGEETTCNVSYKCCCCLQSRAYDISNNPTHVEEMQLDFYLGVNRPESLLGVIYWILMWARLRGSTTMSIRLKNYALSRYFRPFSSPYCDVNHSVPVAGLCFESTSKIWHSSNLYIHEGEKITNPFPDIP